VIRRITAQSTAHPLRSATPLTGAVKAYKIGTRPKWISATDILSRCSVMLRPRRATLTRRGVCVRGVGRVSKYFFVAPRATPKPSLLPESTLVGFPLDCGAHAPSGGGRPDDAWRSREGRSAAHTTYVGAGRAPPRVCVVWDAFQEISLWPPGLPQNRPYCQSQLL